MTETTPEYRANADTGDEQAVPPIEQLTIRQAMDMRIFKNFLILSPTHGGPILAETVRRITEGIHDCENPFPPAPTLPPIGTWGQYGDTYQGDLFVRPAVVQMHQNETQFEVLYFRWGTWLSRVVSLAPILTPGCWSPLPTWAP